MTGGEALAAILVVVFVLSFFGNNGYTAALILCAILAGNYFLKGFTTKGWSL